MRKILDRYERIHAQMELTERSEYYDVISCFASRGLTLDVACGDGWIEQRKTSVIGTDFSKHALKRAKKKGAVFLIRADAHYLPFKNATFNACICLGSLEHFINPLLSLKEMHRVLKTGDFLILTVDAKHSLLFELILRLYRFFKRGTIEVIHQPIEKRVKESRLLYLLKRACFKVLFIGRYIETEKSINYYFRFLSFISHYLPKVSFYHHFVICLKRK